MEVEGFDRFVELMEIDFLNNEKRVKNQIEDKHVIEDVIFVVFKGFDNSFSPFSLIFITLGRIYDILS